MPSRAARLLQLLERLRAHRQPVPGAALAAELQRRGFAVLGLARGDSPLAGIEQVQLDMADPAALEALCEDVRFGPMTRRRLMSA